MLVRFRFGSPTLGRITRYEATFEEVSRRETCRWRPLLRPLGFVLQHVASVAKINEGVADGAINDVNESHDVAAHGRGGSPSVTGERERRR